jgi:HEAT repeat protein
MKKILLIISICFGLSAHAQTETKILALVAKLKPAGQGDNTAIQYTLSGYAYECTGAAKEEMRKSVSRAYCKALPLVKDIENKAFIISLLQICGDNKAVPTLKLYLTNKRLCDPAVRALVQINSSAAKVALLAALKKVIAGKQTIDKGVGLSLIVAIGDLHYIGALDEITACTVITDPVIKRAALFALANIGNEDSEKILAAAAEKSHYDTDSTQATSAYILYIKRLALNWPIGPAVAASEKLLKKSKSPCIRSAALQLLTETRSADATLTLMQAVEDTAPEYRAAAFALAARNLTASNAEQWVRKAELSEGAVKADVITMLGNSRQTAAARPVKAALTDKDPRVKLAAIHAVGVFGSPEMVPALLNTMKTADTLCVTAIRDALLTIRGMDVVSHIQASLPFQPPFAQVALKEVLAIRNPPLITQ